MAKLPASEVVIISPPRRFLTFLFFLSGFSGLLLETIWARRVALIFGHDIRSAGSVVAVTLVGLAAGSLWAGHRADRWRRPLLAYARLEAGIAMWAFSSPFLFRILPDLARLLFTSGSGETGWSVAGLLATALLLLPGGLLMGATTPTVVRAAVPAGTAEAGKPADASAGAALGRLYAANTLGGATGALAAVFLFLPRFGMGRSALLAAGLAALVATAAATWQRRGFRPAGAAPPSGIFGEPSLPATGHSASRGATLLALFATGAVGAGCQVAWTRTLVLVFGSSAHALGLALASSLAGLALGSAVGGRALRRGRSAGSMAGVSLALAALATVVSLLLWARLPVLVVLGAGRLSASFTAALGLQAFLSLIVLIPPAAALGSLLPSLTALLEGGARRAGRDSGDGFSLDTWGSAAGALATAYVLLPAVGAERILRGAALAEVALLALLPLAPPRVATGIRRSLLAAVLALGALLMPRWDPEVLTSGPLLYAPSYAGPGGAAGPKVVVEAIRRRGKLLFYVEGPEATVTVRRGAGGFLSLQINGKTDASTGGDLPTQLLAGHLPALLHGSPRTGLVIGLASGVTAAAVARYPLERIEGVEISPEVARAARFFSGVNGHILSDPRFHLHLGDGRAFLLRTDARYDLIASQPTNPWIAGVTALFTREFFRLARDHLAPGGVLAVWVQGYSLAPADFRSITRSFLEVFPGAQLWEESAGGGDYFLVGRKDGRWPDATELAVTMRGTPGRRSDLQRAGLTDLADLLGRFVAGPAGLARLARGAIPVTDDNLRLEFSAPRSLWRSPEKRLMELLEQVRQPPLAVFAPPDGPAADFLRDRLARVERRRRARIRLALALRSPDWEALSSPALATAVALVRAGRTEPALPLLDAARRQAPQAPAIPLLTGWLQLDRGKVAEAEVAFEEALRLDPASGEAANGLGMAAWREGDLARAADSFGRARQLSPGDPDPANNLASVLLIEGRDGEALGILDGVVRDHPAHVPARINRGVALARHGRIAEAIGEYLQALRLEPMNQDAAYNLRRARDRTTDDGEGPAPAHR